MEKSNIQYQKKVRVQKYPRKSNNLRCTPTSPYTDFVWKPFDLFSFILVCYKV